MKKPQATVKAINERIRKAENTLNDLWARRGLLDYGIPREREQMAILDEKIAAIEQELCDAQNELDEQSVT